MHKKRDANGDAGLHTRVGQLVRLCQVVLVVSTGSLGSRELSYCSHPRACRRTKSAISNWQSAIANWQFYCAAPMTMALFLEPKPRQLQSAASILAERPLFGT